MGEGRKHKSAWDEDDTKHLSGMSEHNSLVGNDRRWSYGNRHYHEVSEPRTRKPRDDHGWPAWESIEDQPIAPSSSFKNTQDGNEFGGSKRYYKNMSPGYDGMEIRNYNDAHGYDQSHFQRNSGKGRSRSPSRSLSRGRERERRRGWTRSRSSSRTRYDAKTRDRTRSRSPNARLSYGWSERKSVLEKSSQICRDFSAGGCRRGSQCRYLHPNTTSHRESDRLVDDPTESWRGRTDHNRVPRHSYSRASSGFESRNDFPDPYHEDRRPLPSKDFSEGNVRRGDVSRYSHPDDDFGQGTGNTSSDKGKSGKPLCKFFTAGKCNRVNCWFLHDDGNTDRRGEATERRSRDKGNRSGVPTRDDATKMLDNSDRRGAVNNSHSHDKGNLWGSTYDDANKILDTKGRGGEVTDMRSRDKDNRSDDATKISDINDNRRDIDTGSCTRDKDTWHGPSWNNATNISDTNDRRGEITESRSHEYGSWLDDPIYDNATKISDCGNGQTDRRSENKNKNWGIIESTLPGKNMSFAEPITTENIAHEKELLISYGSELQDHDGMVNALQENIYPPSQIEQEHCGPVKNNQMSLLRSDALDEVKETITALPIPFSGHQNAGNIFQGDSSISSITDGGPNMMLPNPPNGYCADLNQPNTYIVDPLNVTPHTLNDHKTSQSPRFLEANPQLLANLLAKKLSDQAANSQNFVNKKHPQTYAETPSFPDNSVWAPPVNTLTVQPRLSAVTLELNSTENCRKNAEYDNLNIFEGTEKKQLSPLLAEGPPGFNILKVRPEDVAANSEVNGGNKFVAEESKGVEESKGPETQNGHKKVEAGLGANKDEKGTRLFKNSLVEFVKEILKPYWKEGKMSRDDHKTVVRKVVDKVSSTIHVDNIPKTQEKIDQYLAFSNPKITKLVQAYVARSLKKKS